MQFNVFYQLGKTIYTYRHSILITWVILVLCCLPMIPHLMTAFHNTGFVDEHSLSSKANHFIDKKLGFRSNRFIIMYHSKTLKTSNPAFIHKIKDSLVDLKDYPIKHEIIFPDMNTQQISKDKHTAFAVVLFNSQKTMGSDALKEFKERIKKPSHMTVTLGGEPAFIDEVNKQTQQDLFHADLVAAPIATLVLLLVFGTCVAAMVPVILCGGCALMILASLYLLGHACSLSIFTINIALLLGICLSLDYCLFIISRFREELHLGAAEAIATTMASAGKAVFFSGLAVFVSLGALLLFPVNILFSVGVGGLTAVLIAVVIAIIVLPAGLSVLNERINWLPVRLYRSSNSNHVNPWRTLAIAVVKRPLLFFISALVVLLLLGSPFLNARLGISDQHILPEQSESRQFFDEYSRAFYANELTPIQLIVQTHQGRILTSKHIGSLYDFAHRLENNALIHNVDSIVTTSPSLKKAQYQALYTAPPHAVNPGIRTLLKTTTGQQFTVMSVVSNQNTNSPGIKTLITQLHLMHPGANLSMQITGVPVSNAEVLQSISHLFPYALLWIISLTYMILLLLLRSLFLPLKAIMMNILSLSATYGVLVFVFQEGHLHELLHFTPQGILDVSLLVIIFCALFGFSMDYEVFLLSRIQEAKTSRPNDQSIVYGIEHSSRIITSAAMIVIVTCGSFMVADVLMVKEFGLGIAVAIFVDAFLVRSIFVPATMALVKEWNWYLPKWLDNVLPRI